MPRWAWATSAQLSDSPGPGVSPRHSLNLWWLWCLAGGGWGCFWGGSGGTDLPPPVPGLLGWELPSDSNIQVNYLASASQTRDAVPVLLPHPCACGSLQHCGGLHLLGPAVSRYPLKPFTPCEVSIITPILQMRNTEAQRDQMTCPRF